MTLDRIPNCVPRPHEVIKMATLQATTVVVGHQWSQMEAQLGDQTWVSGLHEI